MSEFSWRPVVFCHLCSRFEGKRAAGTLAALDDAARAVKTRPWPARRARPSFLKRVRHFSIWRDASCLRARHLWPLRA